MTAASKAPHAVVTTVISNEEFLAMSVPELVEAMAKHIKKAKRSDASLSVVLTAPTGRYTFSVSLAKVPK